MLSDPCHGKKLAGLAFNGLRPYLKEKLDGTQLFSLVHLHQRVLAYESRSKEASKSASHKMHLVGHDNLDNESIDVYTTELVWPALAKPSACSSLQTVGPKVDCPPRSVHL
jgi:hypothetical protein